MTGGWRAEEASKRARLSADQEPPSRRNKPSRHAEHALPLRRLPRRQEGVDVLGAADAEGEDAPFEAGVVRVETTPVGFGVEVLEIE